MLSKPAAGVMVMMLLSLPMELAPRPLEPSAGSVDSGQPINTSTLWIPLPDLRPTLATDQPANFTLPGPDGTLLALEVVPINIFAPGGNRGYLVGKNRSDVLDAGTIDGQVYQGKVSGVAESRVSLYRSDFVYGTIEVPNATGHLRPFGPGPSLQTQSIGWQTHALPDSGKLAGSAPPWRSIQAPEQHRQQASATTASYGFDTSNQPTDGSGNGRHGTYHGSIWTNAQPPGHPSPGAIGPGFSTTHHVTIPSSSLHGLPAGTVEAWVYCQTPGANGYQILDFLRDTTGIQFAIGHNGDWKLNVRIGGGTNHWSTCAIPANQWVHVATTWDGAQVKLYVNGALDSTFTNPNGISGTDTAYVGRISSDNTWSFKGYIDDLVISNHAKTSFATSQGCASGNQPPQPRFTGQKTDGVTLGVDASQSTDPDGTIVHYAWEWGDGTTGTGITESHTYQAPGTYHVTLRVRDNAGEEAQTTVSHVLMPESYVLFDVEDRARRQAPPGAGNWQHWVLSAFAYHQTSWWDVGIQAFVNGIYLWEGTNIITNTGCSTPAANPASDYANFLRGGLTVPRINAYQAVTGVDMTDPAGCHGLANQIGSLNNADAASVIEGLDVGIDAYDPGNQQHRGHLSIHEFGHLHGSRHYKDCRDNTWPGWNCNIMCCETRTTLLFDQMGGWWTQGSYNQISAYSWRRLH